MPTGLKCGPGPDRPVAGTGSIYEYKSIIISRISTAVSHVQDFGDATVSPAGDAVSPAGDAATRVGDVHLPG